MKYATMNREQTQYTVSRIQDPVIVPEVPGHPVVAAVDVETSGLGTGAKLVEIGITVFQYIDGLRVIGRYSGFQDPGHPMDPQVIKVHGITDEQVAGQKLDAATIERLISGSNYVVAHNAQFDRRFVDGFSAASKCAKWLCSFEMIDWEALGHDVRKLPVLCERCGFFYEAHRAVNDTDALATLLCTMSSTGIPYVQHLLNVSEAKLFLVRAVGSPFASKDWLKSQFFRWNAPFKIWEKTVWEHQLDDLVSQMDEKVYNGCGKPQVIEIPMERRFM